MGVWVRLISAFVPRASRAAWRREWDAELSAGRERGGGGWRLALGALPDALAVRRVAHSAFPRARATDIHGSMLAPPGDGRGAGMTGIGMELRRALRSLLRAPGFTAASVVTLGAGLGATAAIFTLVDAILLRPLPYPESDRLVRVEHTMREGGTNTLAQFTYGLFAEETRSFEVLGGYWAPESYTLAGDESAERVTGVRATPSLFELLGGRAVAGRLFGEADAVPGGSGVVLSERLWRRQFGGDPGIVGRTIAIEGESREVLGVLGAGSDLPGREVDLWIPWSVPPGVRVDDAFRIHAIGRLRADVSPEAAQSDVERLTRRLPEFGAFYSIYLDELGLASRVRPLREEVVGELERALWILLGAVSLVLLVAGANVAMLFLVRAEGRRSEVAVRSALGAGRTRLLASFLSESTMVTAASAVLGLFMAWGAVRLLVWFAPPEVPRLSEIQVRWATLALLTALAFLTSILLAIYPALRFGRSRPGTVRGAVGQDRRTAAVGSALVVVQVALALVLLSGATLLLQTFRNLRAVDPGFDPSGVLVAELSLPAASYPERDQVRSFRERLIEQVEAVPGVRRAAFGRSPLAIGGCNGMHIEGVVLPDGEFPPCVPIAFVGPGWFEVLGIGVEAGRGIEDADLSQPTVAVVTANAAVRLWPSGDPLAGGLHPTPRRGPPWYPVVGVAGAVRGRGPDQPLTEAVYLPIESAGDELGVLRSLGLVVSVEPGYETATVPELRRIVAGLDPSVPLTVHGTLEDELARTMVRSSFTLFLLVTAAGTAVVLGLVGLYGVVAYRVETRRAEIGIRMAVGARAPQVRTMVLRHSMGLVGLGTAGGLVAALALTRTLSSLLFGVSPTDPVTLGATAVGLAAAAGLATWIPAQRATRVDPVSALRD
jgi:predicted permease